MLRWAVGFLLIADFAAIFGFGGIADGSVDMGRVLPLVFLAMLLIYTMMGVAAGDRVQSRSP